MDGQFIFLRELMLLIVWLSSPALLLGIGFHVFVSRRFGVQSWIAVLATIIFAVVTVFGATVLWPLLPKILLPRGVLPEPELWRSIPPFFLPAYISSIVVAAITSLLAVKTQQCVQAVTRETRATQREH